MPKKRGKARHPIQPLITDPYGVVRFKKNEIVEFLSKNRLNELAEMGFSCDDWEQFAQLIGYSLDGFGTLSYASNRVWHEAHQLPVYQKQPSGGTK